MAHKPDPGLIDDDVPELTDAELAEMRPAREVVPPAVYEMLVHGRLKPRQASVASLRRASRLVRVIPAEATVVVSLRQAGSQVTSSRSSAVIHHRLPGCRWRSSRPLRHNARREWSRALRQKR